MLLKACMTILSAVLCLVLLVGCITDVPSEDGSTTLTETEVAKESTTETETDIHEAETGFPNEPEDGHTKRY